MPKKKLPNKLYKYRSFNINTIRVLTNGEVYYANPRRFNDPLDCDPTVKVDVSRSALEKLCIRMLTSASGDESAQREIENHRYMSTQYGGKKTDPEVEKYYAQLLALQVKNLLDAEMALWGVVSLAERWNSSLMWSHYADDHRGICIEYDMTENICCNIKPVDYGRPRCIKISELARWKLRNSDRAEKNILETYFYAKARQWQYEEEWREIHPSNGAVAAPFRISGIYFGLRCDRAVQTNIVKLFTNYETPVTFYDLYTSEDGYELNRRHVDTGEIEAFGVRGAVRLDFRDITLDDEENS